MSPSLYEFQERTVKRIIKAGGTHLVAFEMGLGKTPTAIEALRRQGERNILIVCPAVVRPHWEKEFDLWWPDHPEVQVLSKGKDFETITLGGIKITSYALAKHLEGLSDNFDSVVLDEVHMLKNSFSKRSKTFKTFLTSKHKRLLLSATPITNEPKDLWNPLNLGWPCRFGTYWQFCFRYALIEKNEYGMKAYGLDRENEKELRRRLAEVCTRVTKAEVAHLLPPPGS